MFRSWSFWLPSSVLLAGISVPAAAQEDVTFRSDVSLVRVDVQVRDRANYPVAGLQKEDFVLREQGKTLPIRSFATEEVPLDVLLLLDVSGSMRPHVERVAAASRQALDTLGKDDRVAIMVFDRVSRVRMPFKDDHDAIVMGLNSVLRQETFNGGTDILRGMLDAAEYLARNARKDARRAIIILTDDVTGRGRDDDAVLSALDRADAILSALLAPDAMIGNFPFPGGGGRGGGGSWPQQYPGGGGGGGLGGGIGDIIFGRRQPSSTPMPPTGGGRYPGPTNTGMQSGGTAEIARESGGDSMPVADATSLENTLSRLRQRYALFFLAPPDARSGQQRVIDVALTGNAARRYADAQLRFRRTYRGEGGTPSQTGNTDETVVVQSAPESSTTAGTSIPGSTRTEDPGYNAPPQRRRPIPDESRGPRGPNPTVGAPAPESNKTTTASKPQPAPEAPAEAAPRKGWRNVDEPEPVPATLEPDPVKLKKKQ